MKLDFGTLAFGYSVKSGGNTPNWSTALGQGKEHKINDDPAINEIIRGMIYCSAPMEKISTKIGKGGSLVKGNSQDSPIVLAGYFKDVYINNTAIVNGNFILLIVRDTKGVHEGRLKLKYGPSNTYSDGSFVYTNENFFKQVRTQLKMADDACWFVSDISIDNQNQLMLTATIVNKDGIAEYEDSAALHSAWEDLESSEIPADDSVRIGDNIIFYGVPGSGKSHKIKTEYCDDERYMERVVFHPDYTYSDFVGQILPENEDGHISYPFVAGPFTRILKKAEKDKYHNYYLIIEELNRGNAPAIFGEVFQLLDRVDGVSEYGISNSDIASEVYGDETMLVKIPKNLFILATMNTADQNVFTLDTAFKRRWRMRSVVSDVSKCSFANDVICDSTISWGSFLNAINPLIIEYNERNLGSEDKRLGAYFVKMQELNDKEYFSEKVLMYLWNDAFKYEHEKVFKEKYKTLDDLIDDFKKIGFKVFADGVKFETLIEAASTVADKNDESSNGVN